MFWPSNTMSLPWSWTILTGQGRKGRVLIMHWGILVSSQAVHPQFAYVPSCKKTLCTAVLHLAEITISDVETFISGLRLCDVPSGCAVIIFNNWNACSHLVKIKDISYFSLHLPIQPKGEQEYKLETLLFPSNFSMNWSLSKALFQRLCNWANTSI